MSAVTRPRGPLPARVYWVRRALVLSVVFVLVFSITRLFGGDGDDGQEQPTARQASGETSSAPTEAATSAPDVLSEEERAARAERRAKRRERRAARQAAMAEPDGPCAPHEVQLGATLRSAPGGDRVEIPLEVTTDRLACVFTVSAKTVVVRINSGDDQIWTSQHCPRAITNQDVVVRAARPATVTLAWSGRRSAPECAEDTKWALPGGYHVVAAALGGEPTDRYFELTAPEAPVVTRTRKQPKQQPAQQRRERRNGWVGTTPTEERANGEGAQEP